MGGISNFLTFLIFISFSHLFATTTINGNAAKHTPRQALEIIIGGGGSYPPSPPPEIQDCPPPPVPICPPPPSPPPPPPPSPSPPPPPRPSPPPPPKPRPRPSSPPPPKPRPRPSSPPPSPFESERLKLVFPVIQAFKKKVINDPLGITKTWKGTNICRDYKGFLCDTVPDFNQKALAGVKFNNYNFGGPDLTLNGFLDGLPDIAFFHANSNNFTGSIPAKVSTLRYLFELDLSNNKLQGNFPYEVLKATKLQFLDLRFNTFFGLLPAQVLNLKLDLLFVNNNKFLQKLPDNLGSTTALFLSFANNRFMGQIPRSIGQASKTLVEVLFLNNQLSGCLPYEIGLLKKATVFDVGFNRLTGPIPHSFQCLEKMELLNLAGNFFYGTVPEPVCSLPKLSNFTLSYNYFTQVGPECRKLIKKGMLDVKMNCILGLPHQRSQETCAKFFSSRQESCPDAKSLNYVPCSKRYSNGRNYVESSDFQSIPMAPVPAPAPRFSTYGALSPN